MALSHCWGPPEHICKTTRLTLEDHKLEIPWSDLSKTFQEAIEVTRRLGIRYLWIDSLCIIQGDAEDWDREAENMGNIYMYAYLTLAATASASGAGGLFAERDDNVISFVLPPDPDTDSKILTLKARRRRLHQALNVQNLAGGNPLSRRAWAYQERLLAKRILHFGSEELIWECRTEQTCECAHPFVSRTNLNEPIREDCTLAETWQDLVSSYTPLELTYEEDRLPAL
ncbi:HET-domain-containing protein [Cadophora sp. DSE1049]|nr:HET-domain-containing protein [Cadophora sp. DSE1049]